jgi:branched-chain amino acid transport system permease protein
VLQYVIAGLVIGGIYAIAAAGLTITYASAGILNFSFGALAYFVARFYYWLHSQQHLALVPAALIALFILGPLLGVLLYLVLFRMLQLASTLIKIVATLGVSVCVPPLATLLFGDAAIVQAPGLAPEPVSVYRFLGVPVTMDQLIDYGCVVGVVVLGFVVLRYTDIGLRVRAMVDSPAMTSLSGTNPAAVSIGVWAVSVFLAGLAGILAAPVIGLDPTDYTLLMASAFAAVVAARLRNVPVAVAIGLAIGVAGSLVPDYLPPSSSFTAAVIPSLPFAVTAIFLIVQLVRYGRADESDGVGGALDQAIRPHGGDRLAARSAAAARARPAARRPVPLLSVLPSNSLPALLGIAVLCVASFILGSFWIGLLAQGVAYAVIFLAFTLVVGEGGMIWACEVTFAGVGAVAAAQFAASHGWPVLAAVAAGGLIAVPMGLLIGLLTIRMGGLYVTLVTLMFGLLMDNLVFTRTIFTQNGIGVAMPSPGFATTSRALLFLGLGIFCAVSLLIVNVRRSTTGLALSAVRSSEAGSKTTGISVLQMKLLIAGVAAFVAAVGGAVLAMNQQSALPGNYATLGGIVWLAVLVTAGIRSNMAALVAGLMFTVLPGIALEYLPGTWGQVPPVLFGLGAVLVAKNPDGWMAQQADQARWLWRRARGAPEATATASAGTLGQAAAGGSDGGCLAMEATGVTAVPPGGLGEVEDR